MPSTCSRSLWNYADRTGHPLLLGMAGTLRGFVHLHAATRPRPRPTRGG